MLIALMSKRAVCGASLCRCHGRLLRGEQIARVARNANGIDKRNRVITVISENGASAFEAGLAVVGMERSSHLISPCERWRDCWRF
jgi:hypothetical protein